MADPTVTIRVTTNADQATQGLQRAAKNIKESSTQQGGGSTRSAQGSSASSGKRLTLGMGLQIAGQGVDLLAQGIGNLAGQRRTGERIGALGEGALGGAATGAMIGGPVGAAIGGAAGLVVGAFQQLSQEAKETREGLMALRLGTKSTVHSISASREDDAFNETLKYKSKDERLAAIQTRKNQLSFDGYYSIQEIEKRQKRSIRHGTTDTEAYKYDEMMLGLQKSRLNTLLGQEWNEQKTLSSNSLEATTLTDSLSAMGGSIGAQVDVADVNKSMLDELKRINANLERTATFNPADGKLDISAATAYGL